MLFLYLAALDDKENADAFEALYYVARRPMFRAAEKILGKTDEAEEAVQDAFLGIARNSSRVLSLSPAEQTAYACRAARNAAINRKAKRDKRAEQDTPMPDCDYVPVSDDAIASVCRKETVEAIARAVRALPDAYRDVLWLRFAEDLSVSDVARRLRLSRATVRGRIERGKVCLKELLEKEALIHDESGK